MGIDDVITEFKLDVLDLTGDLEVLRQLCLFSCLYRNGCSSFVATAL
jgi:hypothetical protein